MGTTFNTLELKPEAEPAVAFHQPLDLQLLDDP